MNHRQLATFAIFLFLCSVASAQEREIHQKGQVWISMNSTTRATDRFGWVADFHVRRTDFLENSSFNFLRLGPQIWLTDRLTLTLGYAHMWKAPAREEWHTWSGEDRIYQQIQYSSKIGRVSLLERIRNEQRRQDLVKNDGLTGDTLFADRVRLLLSFTIPVSSNPARPALVLSDEVLFQFGKDIVTNAFDQNRFFIGIKKNLSSNLSFDIGYMPIYQQKPSGYQYDLNHTLRCFFYFTPDLRKLWSHPHESAGDDE